MVSAAFGLGVDFGTSSTVAMLRWPDGRVKPLLFEGSPLLPSAVYLEDDGRLIRATIAGLELSIREHFAGFKSHSTILAGLPAVIVLGVGFWQEWPRPVNLVAAALVFATGFYLLREAFKRRSGGLELYLAGAKRAPCTPGRPGHGHDDPRADYERRQVRRPIGRFRAR